MLVFSHFDREEAGEGVAGGAGAGDAAAGADGGAAATEVEGADGAGAGAGGDGAPAYTPNFAFKYRGTDRADAEAQFDDIFKPLIKDADTEKKIREMHEKAFGLDFVKQDRDTLRQTFQETQQKYTEQATALQTLGMYVKNDDFDSFFEALKIPKKSILDYAIKLVQLEKMAPEQRAAYNAQRAETQRRMSLEMQNAELTQQFQNLSVERRETELSTTLAHPQVAPLIEAFDQQAGKPGAFRDLVIQKGQHHFFTSGMDVPVHQVVNEVIGLLGLKPAQPGGTPAAASGVVARGSQGKPVLPLVPGKGGSPAKKVPNSTAGLRELANQLS